MKRPFNALEDAESKKGFSNREREVARAASRFSCLYLELQIMINRNFSYEGPEEKYDLGNGYVAIVDQGRIRIYNGSAYILTVVLENSEMKVWDWYGWGAG